ncbi:MAG: exodeoxyribonuclease VII large subunit [Oligoflexales bacterium]
MTLYYHTRDAHFLVISGKTFQHKDFIKSLGGTFSSDAKVWHVPNTDPNKVALDTLCKTIGGGERTKLNHDALMVAAPIVAPVVDASDLTIRQLMDRVNHTIRSSFSTNMWILGEIQNLNIRANGVFFQLAEPKEESNDGSSVTINCTLWNSAAASLAERHGPGVLADLLKDGLRVRVKCQLALYKDRGQLSLTIQDIDPNFTKGMLALAKENLLKELRSKGLDRQNKQLAIPPFPLRIGLVTADNSRAKGDFLNQLLKYGYPGEVVFFSARMQGEELVRDVVQALDALSQKSLDLIVITRGGGSASDLRWFDQRELALKVACSPVPVVAAIGHHDDVCVTEIVAHTHEKTPTAAADFVLNKIQQTRERITRLANQQRKIVTDKLGQKTSALAALNAKVQSSALSKIYALMERLLRRRAFLNNCLQKTFHHNQQRVARLAQGLKTASSTLTTRRQMSLSNATMRFSQAYKMSLVRTQSQLELIHRKMTGLDPQPWLSKGWTRLLKEGKVVFSVDELVVGDLVKATTRDGKINMEIKKLEKTNGGLNHE